MDTCSFDRESYLKRIGHSGDVKVSEEGLETLQRGQLFHIPFENFDVLLKGSISLEPDGLFDKIVRRGRGGYCFELNGLFLAALKCFGFEARPLLARVHRSGPPMGRGHQISLISIQGRQWIADVGFGVPFPPCPLPLECNRLVQFNGQSFRLTDAGPFGIMLQHLKEAEWQNLYSFDLGHVCAGDIIYGNHYAATHPASVFTSNRVAARPTSDGDVSLFNRTLRQRTSKGEHIRELVDGPSYLDTLRTHFDITLDVSYERLPPME
ncbi:arylamine N-acetyltransferase family protein [Desulfopila aestuarii]|uniref:N-hydroxyarylamine O-acetyltransferase n=1 Tax=Desulfopila aestuarii DSM 18488 TaxID=1121416 RepID=A0A1M7XYL9_9BACT|nr:arylamine N-acetyltransferase [Desulfopila aestuarii]SHO44133.1 N-hydroxyarylamine O-acetyltransferase [Desulfopila aestuarii DSM 18488]